MAAVAVAVGPDETRPRDRADTLDQDVAWGKNIVKNATLNLTPPIIMAVFFMG